MKICELCHRRYSFACVPCMERYGVLDLPVSYIRTHPVIMTVPVHGAWAAGRIVKQGGKN